MARTLGAPVTEPQGNSVLNTSSSATPLRVRASMSDVNCQTVGQACAWNKCRTLTEWGSAIRDMSFRSRSTIITFSARSFGDESSS
jgi:hypothetical protein